MLCAAASDDASDESSSSDWEDPHLPTDRAESSHEGLWQRGDADRTASSNGGLWQRGNAESSQEEGTWDFDTGTSKSPSQSAAAGPPAPALHTSSQKQMLYIQMEFCPRTLKQVLLAGPIEEADAWQVGCLCKTCASYPEGCMALINPCLVALEVRRSDRRFSFAASNTVHSDWLAGCELKPGQFANDAAAKLLVKQEGQQAMNAVLRRDKQGP